VADRVEMAMPRAPQFWKQIRRSYRDGGWWPATTDRTLFDRHRHHSLVHRHRGTAIHTPDRSPDEHRMSTGPVESTGRTFVRSSWTSLGARAGEPHTEMHDARAGDQGQLFAGVIETASEPLFHSVAPGRSRMGTCAWPGAAGSSSAESTRDERSGTAASLLLLAGVRRN